MRGLYLKGTASQLECGFGVILSTSHYHRSRQSTDLILFLQRTVLRRWTADRGFPNTTQNFACHRNNKCSIIASEVHPKPTQAKFYASIRSTFIKGSWVACLPGNPLDRCNFQKHGLRMTSFPWKCGTSKLSCKCIIYSHNVMNYF